MIEQLSDNMLFTLKLIIDRPRAVRDLTQAQRNAARALKDRGYVEWSLTLSKWQSTSSGESAYRLEAGR